MYYKACTKLLPSTTLYYTACTKSFPVLPCTTQLAQSTSKYYFVLQSLHKLLPSTTVYYKACTMHFPALLRATKLAQSTSEYYLCTTKLAQEKPKYPRLRHVGAAKQAFRARRPPILTLLARYQTGLNAHKACHARDSRRHDNLLGNAAKSSRFRARLPPILTRN